MSAAGDRIRRKPSVFLHRKHGNARRDREPAHAPPVFLRRWRMQPGMQKKDRKPAAETRALSVPRPGPGGLVRWVRLDRAREKLYYNIQSKMHRPYRRRSIPKGARSAGPPGLSRHGPGTVPRLAIFSAFHRVFARALCPARYSVFPSENPDRLPPESPRLAKEYPQ